MIQQAVFPGKLRMSNTTQSDISGRRPYINTNKIIQYAIERPFYGNTTKFVLNKKDEQNSIF